MTDRRGAKYQFYQPFGLTGDSASIYIPRFERLALDGSHWIKSTLVARCSARAGI